MKPLSSLVVLPALLAVTASAAPSSKLLRATRDLAQAAVPKPVDCKLFTATAEPTPWSECKDDGTNAWYQTKFLSIKTPAANGGKPCPDETSPDRTAKKLCAPVPCKALKPSADLGSFSDCYQQGTAWVKTKTLGIAVQALYGGTCDPKDRQYTVTCKAIDCKLFTATAEPTPWSECKDDGTNAWYQTKLLSIKTPAANGGKPCPDETSPDRTAKKLCAPVPCKALAPSADLGPYGDCYEQGTAWVKTKTLGIAVQALYGGKCDPKDRQYTVPCNAIDCVAYTKETDPGTFGPCTDDGTGKYFKSKVLGIQTRPQNGGAPCLSVAKRTIKELCEPVNCKAFTKETDKGDFSACEENTNDKKWYKTKVLGIETEAQYGGLECEPKEKRTLTEPCEPVKCVPADAATDQTAFSTCAKDDSDGKWYKTKVLPVKDVALYGGTCDDKDRTVKELCEPVNCKAFTKETDKGDFSACEENTNDKKWYKTKVLGIETEAQYGGLECEPKEKRTLTEPCEPVNCKPVLVEKDTGDYSACVKDEGSGKFRKFKILAVAEDAQFGGTCLDDDRKVYADCEATDCETYTELTDPGKFGDCEEYETGKFRRSKILGIIKDATNGGLCSTDAQRTVYKDCEPVKCVPADAATDQTAFSTCAKDDSDGKWYKTKVLPVKDVALYGGTCDDKDRTVKELCEPVNCKAFTKETDKGDFSACEENTNDKKWYKTKVLGIETEAQYGGLECEPKEKRTLTEPCEPVKCVPADAATDQTAFSTCAKDDSDGKWYKTKVLPVKDVALYGGTCDDKDRTVKELCEPVNCKAFTKETDKGDFSACEENTNDKKWYKTKVLGIETEAQYGGLECEPKEKRTLTEPCEPVKCVPADAATDQTAFSTCAKDDSDGKWYKTKVLPVKDVALYGGTCDDKDRTVKELCEPVNCKAFTKETDKGDFSACEENTNDKKWYKTKVLGIETEAQYGGLECEPKEKRTLTEPCEPVKCVPADAATDQTAFSTCAKDDSDGKWYKTKVLPVKDVALYGGTCDDKDRTVKELCEPVNCKAFTKETDKGDFSACEENTNDKKWYKTKVLGIETEAQYGGLECEPKEKRTITEECLAVDCVLGDASSIPWGACTIAADTKYYRVKPPSVVSQPKYGGLACPTELKELCTQNDYCVSPSPYYNTCVTQLAQCGEKITNKVYRGTELKLYKNIQMYECCDKCAHTPNCMGYSFKPAKAGSQSECSLKSVADSTKTTTSTGTISSPVLK